MSRWSPRRTTIVWGAMLLYLWACSPAPSTPGSPGSSDVSGAVTTGPAAPVASPELRAVRIVTQPSALSDAGIYLADARGYFREAGIQIDRVGMNAVEGTTALIGGQVEIAAFPPTTGLLNATGRGVALKVVADKGEEGNGFAYQSVVVRRDLYESGAVQRIADLRGRRLALNLNGSPLEASIAAGLRQSGLTLADVDQQPHRHDP